MVEVAHDERFCALGDGRSFVDPVSTLSHISSIQITKHLPALWEGILPREALPTALHEATHFDHLCAPVGIALAAISLRVRQLALGLHNQSVARKATSRTLEELIEWRQRYEVVTTVLRPISEGLACVAQFDSLALAEHDTIPFPMQFAAVVAARDVPAVLRPAALQAWLTSARLESEVTEGKANLYAHAFHCRNGGYLPGYLLVRSIRAQCTAIDPQFEAAANFLYLIRHVIFSDYGLVLLMLSLEVEPALLAKQLISRICERLHATSNLRATYECLIAYRTRAAGSSSEPLDTRDASGARCMRGAFEEVAGHPPPTKVPDSEFEALLYNDLADVTAGTKALKNCIKLGQGQRFADRRAVDLNRAVWKRRGWFWLSSYAVTLTSVGTEIFFSGEKGLTGRLPLLGSTDQDHSGSGWLTCAYSSKQAAVVVAAGVDKQVVAAASHWGARDGSFENAMRLLGEQSALLKVEDEVRALVEQSLSRWTSELRLDEVRLAASAVATRKIAEIILSSRGTIDIDDFLAATQVKGLAGFMSPALLRACALLSICASSGLAPDAIQVEMKKVGYNLDEVIWQVAKSIEPLGGQCRFVGNRLQMSL
jgi:hypothetical protein